MPGRNLDWVIACFRTPSWGVEGIVVAGTNHVGVPVRLQTLDANALVVRMEQPTQIPQEAMGKHAGRQWWHTIEATLGDPPEDWEHWTNSAEEGLLTNLGITRQDPSTDGGGDTLQTPSA